MKKFNFRWCVYVLLLVVILPLFSVCFIPKQKVYAANDFIVSESQNKITSISGDFVGMHIKTEEDVFDALNNFKDEFGFPDSRKSLVFNKQVKSVTGTVYRFYQIKNDIRVYNSEVIVSVNNEGRITLINGAYYKNVNYKTEGACSVIEAGAIINNEYETTSVEYLENVIFMEGVCELSYVFEVHMLDDIYKVLVGVNSQEILKVVKLSASLTDTMLSGLPSLTDYTKEDATTTYVDVNGETVTLSIDKYVSKTTSEYFYILGDSERAIYVAHGQNKTDAKDALYYASKSGSAYFNDTIAVKAYDYIMRCYDFYLDSNNFGVSIEGLKNPKGKDIQLLAIVHYDVNYENAAFYLPYDTSTTGYFYFGDGNINRGTGSFVNSFDVVGHEYQHCITDSIVELEYLNESGAICESYSDIFGAFIEGHEMTDEDFWKMGEDVYLTANGYFRDMSNPTLKGYTASYENMHPLCTSVGCSHTNCDNGGVHYNSTLFTYATYVMYQRDPEFFNKTNILKLWYETLTKLSENSTFIEFANLMLNSAKALNFPEENILDIEFAFATIDLPGYSGVKVWGDYYLQYLQGTGTIAYPYLINSVADLASVAYYVNVVNDESYANARYQVNVDLDLKDLPWVGIGTRENPFNGSFNGGGYTISGLNVEGTASDKYSGLFAYTAEDAYIYDVRVGAGNVTAKSEYVGSIVGLLQGTISSCSSALNIIGDNVGGLVGLVNNTNGGEKVLNSFTTCDLEGNIVGGLVAEFATPKNATVKIHLSGIIASSYATGTFAGKVVGGLVGRANGVYFANVITTATVQDSEENAVLGGLVGELSFSNILNNLESISDVVSNMILGSKVAVSFNKQNETVKQGLLIGEFLGVLGQGSLYVENTDVKKVQGVDYCSNPINTLFSKFVDVNFVEDNVFEGVFDFDSEKFYKDEENWTIIDGIEAFNMVTTFELKGQNKMPSFRNADFWVNQENRSLNFSGFGTESHPYIIQTPQQLAGLAWAIADPNNEGYNSVYGSKHYRLGADIDLSGKMWVGIGATHISVINGYSSGTLYAFTGTFDGYGYSILNMSATAAYMVAEANSSGSNYKLIEFSPALFSVTSMLSDGTNLVAPTIKNLTIEDVNNKGSYSAGVVSKAYMSINLDNVSVNNGNITSNFISGGLIASIEGLGQGLVGSNIVSNIVNCDTQVNVSSRVAGGAVGYVANATTDVGSTLNIINYLNRGKISVVGEELDSEVDGNSSYYYRPIAGSVIGITLIKNLNIINAINLADVVSYNYGAYIGGFIGATGNHSNYATIQMNILIDGCKQVGKIYYVFDKVLVSGGSVIGGTHKELLCEINLTVTETTHTNLDADVIANNKTVTGLNVDSKLNISNQEIGTGVFDIYNEDYYSNEVYFNQEYFWDENQRTKLFVSVKFRNDDGEELKIVILDKDQTSVNLEDVPIPEKEPTAQYEYVFKGWSRPLDNITQSISVYAEYETKVREYVITYLDENGNIVETRTLPYGTSVNQNVKAPEKKSGFLFQYNFIRWGETGQTVTGELELSPVYKISLTRVGRIIVLVGLGSVLVLLYVLSKRNRDYQAQ